MMSISPLLPTAIRYIPRRLHVFTTAAMVYMILKITQLLNRYLGRDEDSSAAAWVITNTKAAKIILKTSSRRRGIWIKCCQYIGARSDALPLQYSQVLSKSFDACPPSSPTHIIRTVEDELSQSIAGRQFLQQHRRKPKIEDFFSDFDPKNPIASASIAQVHVATLRNTGKKVVLKVQHPGVRPMLLQDLEDMKTLLRLVAGAEPKYDMRPFLDGWIKMVPLETSFLNELKNLQSIRQALNRATGPFANSAYVPEPNPELTTDKLLVMEYIDGYKISDTDIMNQHNIDRSRLITEITKSFGVQLFQCGVFSGDPHPGNFLLHKLEENGAPVLLDFGICVNVNEEMQRGFAKLIIAAGQSDSYSLIQSLGDIGLKLNRADPVASLDLVQYLFRTTKSQHDSLQEQHDFKEDLGKRKEEIERNERENPVEDMNKAFGTSEERANEGEKKTKKLEQRSPVDAFPDDLVFFFRSLGMLRGLAVTLEVEHSYLDALKPFAEQKLLESCPENERLKEVVSKPIYSNGLRTAITVKVLRRIFNKMYEKNLMYGMQVAAYRNGKLILNMAAGKMGRNNPRPVKLNSLFGSFSSTKGLTSILFASIQDEYNVEYDHLVTKYWPEYGQNGKENTTIAHILSHSAGLPYALPEDMAMTRLRDDWRGIIQHLEKAKPSFPPGSRSEYHSLTYGWLVAGLIMKITGKTYQEHLIELNKKLGIEDECFCGTMPSELLPDNPSGRVASLGSSLFYDLQSGPISKLMKHIADQKRAKEGKKKNTDSTSKIDTMKDIGDVQAQTERALENLELPSSGITKAPAYILDLNFFNHPILRAGFVPSANGHFTARALAALFAAVSNDGIVNGKRILAKGRAKKMSEKIITVSERKDRSWAAGLTLYNTKDSNENELQYGAIGHGGIGGSLAFAVPSKGFSMAVTLNKLNAISLSAAVIIAVVCRTLEMPMPTWYYDFASRVVKSFKEGEIEDINDEESLMNKILSGDGDTDLMKILVG